MFDRDKCDFCGDCTVLCPYTDYGREEAVGQFRRLVDGETPPIVAECFTCVACNEFCEKGSNPLDLILARQEQTGALNIADENTQLFRNLPNAPTEVIPGEPGRPALSLCSVGDLVPGLFEGPLFDGMTVLKGGDFFCGVEMAIWSHQ